MRPIKVTTYNNYMPKPEFSQKYGTTSKLLPNYTFRRIIFLIKKILLKQMAQIKHASGPVLLRTWNVRPYCSPLPTEVLKRYSNISNPRPTPDGLCFAVPSSKRAWCNAFLPRKLAFSVVSYLAFRDPNCGDSEDGEIRIVETSWNCRLFCVVLCFFFFFFLLVVKFFLCDEVKLLK
jgi:hypothetical protein